MKDSAEALHLENQLCFPLYAASRLTTKVYGPLLKELDLTYPQYLVMLSLWQNGEQSVKAIGNCLLLESNTLTPLLKRLEQKELVGRIRSSEDERSVTITLTEKGKQLQNNARTIPSKIVQHFGADSLSESEIIQFQQTLWKVVNALKEKTTG